MRKIFPLLQTDFYKQSHYKMYDSRMTKLYSNLTPRKSRIPGINNIVFFGLQYYIKEYLIKQWDEGFFKIDKNVVIPAYSGFMNLTLGPDSIDTKHIEELHDLGYLPLSIKALPEGARSPIGVPCMTITNTHPNFGWLVNFFETIISCILWGPITSATIAHEYRKILDKYALLTVGDTNFVQWQGHDFSMRGMSSLESACTSGAGHLLSFTGTDTIPAINLLSDYYNTPLMDGIIGSSVPATEHSVMCVGTKEDEIGTFKALLDKYPTGILSVVSDTWDLWKVVGLYLPELKDQIISRNGKLVIRPDSGDPVKILTGYLPEEIKHYYEQDGGGITHEGKSISHLEEIGLIEALWSIFGGTLTEQGYRLLDSHIGAIYGDSITLERAKKICERLERKGFASINVVLGIGSYTYQYNTRDTFGMAVKATYCELGEEKRAIFKDPITDDGTKKSAKGLLAVFKDPMGNYELYQDVDEETEKKGELKEVFRNGNLLVEHTLQEIRERLKQ